MGRNETKYGGHITPKPESNRRDRRGQSFRKRDHNAVLRQLKPFLQSNPRRQVGVCTRHRGAVSRSLGAYDGLGLFGAVIDRNAQQPGLQRRDRALVAFTILTGARDGAIASLKLKHVNVSEGQVDQDARQVKTKFSKSFTTWFFPVGDDLRGIVADWIDYLRRDQLWGLDDPLFPATKIVVGESRHFEASGLDRKHWSSAGPIRAIFKNAFAAAGLPYFNPHSFRKTLALLGGQICKSPEEYKAWSQNLGHENVLTTFSSYGDVAHHRQAEIIRALGTSEQRARI
jgi:integrase